MRFASPCILAALGALLLVLVPAPAAAHQRLLHTSPESGAVLHIAPSELRLAFNEALELAFSEVDLIGPEGVAVALGAARIAPDSAGVLVLPIRGELHAGQYTVRWQTAGRDGHPVRGEYAFAVAPDANGLAVGRSGEASGAVTAPGFSAPPDAHHPAAGSSGIVKRSTFGAESAGYVVVRWVTFVALLGVVGAPSFRLLVLGALRRRTASEDEALLAAAKRGAARVGLMMIALLVLATLGRLYAQSLAMHGAMAALSAGRIGVMLTHTVWGWGWLIQAGTTIMAGIGFTRAFRSEQGGWLIAGVAALVLAATPALSGHAAATSGSLLPVAIVVDWLHVLAAGGWLGSLLVLLAAGIPAAYGLGPARRGAAVRDLVRAFSPTALFFTGLLVLSGVVSIIIHSNSLTELLDSRYGLLLLAKLAVFLLAMAIGAYNLLRVQPALGDDSGTTSLRHSVRFELAFGAVVLLITALLVATALPGADAPRTGTGSAVEAVRAIR